MSLGYHLRYQTLSERRAAANKLLGMQLACELPLKFDFEKPHGRRLDARRQQDAPMQQRVENCVAVRMKCCAPPGD